MSIFAPSSSPWTSRMLGIFRTLPAGLFLTSNPVTGLISGAPQQPGLFNFRIRATDSLGCIGERPYTMAILVAAPGVPTLDSLALAILAVLLALAGVFVANRFTT